MTEDVIFIVLESWSLEWHAPVGFMVETYKFATQCKKEGQSFEWRS